MSRTPESLDVRKKFSHVLREHGPYDVLHGHCHRFTGLNLFLAYRAGIPIRIAHSHNDIRSLRGDWGLGRRAYHRLMDWLIDRYATVGLAASSMAAEDLFGPGWRSDQRWRILFCGIDFSPFRATYDRLSVMGQLGLERDARVITHVGRFTHQKNCPFILDVFSHALKKDPRLRLLFVGDGVLEETVREEVDRRGLTKEVAFLGSRPMCQDCCSVSRTCSCFLPCMKDWAWHWWRRKLQGWRASFPRTSPRRRMWRGPGQTPIPLASCFELGG